MIFAFISLNVNGHDGHIYDKHSFPSATLGDVLIYEKKSANVMPTSKW